ncbi:hypothetical protein [Chryseobacterium sp. StRB126]|uniref:hypothetical protein n=1 Tax=Chryseobacterium sp. StRB126 TaxID=878220 RepID=UPI0011876883|nr:hypothetical protein [Chryseobacterium sp. StRB126]
MNAQTLNSKLEAYINLSEEEKKKKPMYKSDYFRLFDYPDETSSIDLMSKKEIKVGDDFRDHKGRLHVITEIVSYRPHKGVFSNEENRHTVAIVNSEIIPGV